MWSIVKERRAWKVYGQHRTGGWEIRAFLHERGETAAEYVEKVTAAHPSLFGARMNFNIRLVGPTTARDLQIVLSKRAFGNVDPGMIAQSLPQLANGLL